MNVQDFASAIRAIADPSRIRILSQLASNPSNVNDLSKSLDVRPYNVSKHLTILRQAGLIEYQRNGRLKVYQIAQPNGAPAVQDGKLDLGYCVLDLPQIMSGEENAVEPEAEAAPALVA